MVGKQPRVSKQRNADIDVMKLRPSVSTSTTPNLSSGESNSCQGLFQISSPLRPDEMVIYKCYLDRYKGFLERCHYCFKKLELPQDVFMYDSTAYCKAECRLARMERDGVVIVEPPEAAKKTRKRR